MRRVLLACALASACGRAENKPPPPAAKQPAPAAHLLRVLRVSGAVPLTPDAPLPSGPIVLPAGAALTVAIDEGVRVELRGPGRYQLSGEQLLTSAGLASVDVAAQAQRAGQHAFVVASPSGQLEVPFAARLVLRAPERGASELALISGEAVADGALPVGANVRVCFAAAGAHVVSLPGFATVEAALASLPASDACAADPPAALAELDRELGQQLDAFARSKAEQDALIMSQVSLLAPRYQGGRVVRKLAALAQQTLAARTRVLVLRAQLSAAQLGATNDPGRASLLARAAELEKPAAGSTR